MFEILAKGGRVEANPTCSTRWGSSFFLWTDRLSLLDNQLSQMLPLPHMCGANCAAFQFSKMGEIAWSGWQRGTKKKKNDDGTYEAISERKEGYIGYLWILERGRGRVFLWQSRDTKAKKSGIMGNLPISRHLLPAPSEPQSTRPTNERDCAPVPVLCLHCDPALCCLSLQQTLCDTTLEGVMSPVEKISPCWIIREPFGHMRRGDPTSQL